MSSEKVEPKIFYRVRKGSNGSPISYSAAVEKTLSKTEANCRIMYDWHNKNR